MKKLRTQLIAWWHRRYRAPFTVVVDRSPFRRLMTEGDSFIYVNGLARARREARRWVRRYTCGQARVCEGHFHPEAE